MPQSNRRERFHTVREIRFSRNRELVVSVLGDRLVLGQRLEYEDDGGRTQHAFLKNAPSLEASQAQELIGALKDAITEIERRAAALGRE